ncbi:MAG: undecaprenyldiphospho-muramoylpentapeptide beta-N-acetylglucosaminyltransferase [Deltaproteobacteria bacterium]|nr:undecaprenyldiphospho-muramoylpentapeptide beta-N-acetylglucosaminyltransferase [Deltaproteobacteria bacterium]MBW2417044.1 undecaprenyldiphospho-muramoylpentapeptide beta-N-acetylglucosaminyltransferase [Deltaproteobacteria bacterium]
MQRSWVIAGGGTGGHVTPALALGEELQRRGEKVLFIGSERGLEAQLVPESGFELVALPSQQVMGRSIAGRLRGALGILASVGRARTELKRCRANAVLSVGGYAAMPAALAALTRRTPLFLVEPNAVPGRVNRLCARFARRVFVGFEAAAKALGGAAKRSECTGVPLRAALVESFAVAGPGAAKDAEPRPGRVPRRKPHAPFRLLVFGGSQGARQINHAMMRAAPHLAGLGIEIFHQAGEADREAVLGAYADAGLPVEVVAFERNMPARYAWADIAVCRAGALTVAELALSGLPALLVPYPYAADDHQAANARELERAGAARRLEGLEDSDESGARLAGILAELFAAPERLVAMGEAASSLARPGAAARIIDLCTQSLSEDGEPGAAKEAG